jgi:hypothetical protein
MNYKDCVIIYKTGKGITLRATSLTVENRDKMIVVYDGNDIMAIVPFDEIKTVLFCDVVDAEKLCEILMGGSA